MIAATEADRPAIEAFLHAHAAMSIYPLTYLARHGMAGGHSHAMKFWLRWHDGRLTDVIAVTQAGNIYPQCTTNVWAAAAAALAGTKTHSFSGEADQIAQLRVAIRLTHRASVDLVEPYYVLPLDQLVVPDVGALTLHPLDAVPLELLTTWRAMFLMESLSNMVETAVKRAVAELRALIALDTHRVLMDRGRPVAMTGFNGAFRDIVQVGGVFTPPELRSRGYARIAVALHLLEARAQGVQRATLAAANVKAARAYEAIGFRRNGSFAGVFYDEAQVICG
ncbi:GNAT family N-acetyltransferase [Yoonia sp.]|uniref:GNAT family N-acetyltransferase n=1 Tax=Yoonia sp. TaxID=2212373 RepID=UPI0025D8D6C9|nr:GNAT family N-acetyltransferase [Yoonia sp.]